MLCFVLLDDHIVNTRVTVPVSNVELGFVLFGLTNCSIFTSAISVHIQSSHK